MTSSAAYLQFVRRPSTFVWTAHIVATILCLPPERDWPKNLLLAVLWIVTAIATIKVSVGGRKKALLVILASAAIASTNLLSALFSLGCRTSGDCL
jgi:hypothetical protein